MSETSAARPAATFDEVEDALLSRWPETRLEPSLDRIRAFTELLGDPQRAYPVVHLTGANPPAYGVARVGPVYTPAAHRGRGYASAAVAQVSRHFLERGVRVCLFTDQANPTSNRIYQALGFHPVVDMANLVLR